MMPATPNRSAVESPSFGWAEIVAPWRDWLSLVRDFARRVGAQFEQFEAGVSQRKR
jgi:hypothetical protein